MTMAISPMPSGKAAGTLGTAVPGSSTATRREPASIRSPSLSRTQAKNGSPFRKATWGRMSVSGPPATSGWAADQLPPINSAV